jgi:hypothetical protein
LVLVFIACAFISGSSNGSVIDGIIMILGWRPYGTSGDNADFCSCCYKSKFFSRSWQWRPP